ncbi:MarR family winged helix-turn-helix transcriptional regulator [Streptomyces dangxiongensis]|uniref:MarR family winged helix-turn-helix transcriptional regulator n=1 Tax=Streptomyces dangxiongensis TaxID=1442032 RepID=UPI0013CF0408|nr:MarR family transcriptional regulator [Streptomyces dangxiongensis]
MSRSEGGTAEVAEGLVRLWECIDRRVAPAVPPAQFRVLRVVGTAGVVTSTKIAEATGAMPSSISRLIGRLQGAGLLVKEENCSNRRETLIRLTADGQELLREVEEQRLDELRLLLKPLSLRGRQALLRGLISFNQSPLWD